MVLVAQMQMPFVVTTPNASGAQAAGALHSLLGMAKTRITNRFQQAASAPHQVLIAWQSMPKLSTAFSN